MTKIIDQLPILEKRTFPRFDDKHVKVHSNQILLWVSIHLTGIVQPEQNTPKIPALLDTGNNFDFSIQHRHSGSGQALIPLFSRCLATSRLMTRL